MTSLTGTEKQIKWAEDIRAEFTRKFEILREEYASLAKRAIAAGKATEEIAEQGRQKLEGQITAALSQSDAKFWIDNRNDNSREILNH